MGKISFDDFVNDKPELEDSTDKALDEDEVVNLVHMENDAQEESNEEEGGESWGSDESKVTNKTSGFLSSRPVETFPRVIYIASWFGWSTWVKIH